MPGPPFGPSYRMTTMSPGWIRPASMASMAAVLPVEHPGGAVEPVDVEPGDLDHRTLRGERPPQDRDAADVVDRLASEPVDDLAVGTGAPIRARFSPSVRPVTVISSRCSRPSLGEQPHDHRHAADAVDVDMW